jgi:hypothetical protein
MKNHVDNDKSPKASYSGCVPGIGIYWQDHGPRHCLDSARTQSNLRRSSRQRCRD